MGRRRKEPLLDALISLPWWMSALLITIGVVAVLAARAAWLSWVENNHSLGMFAGAVIPL